MAHAYAQSHFWACDTHVIHFDYALRAALACTKKKRSIRNGKLEANRVSATEDRGKKD